MTNPTNKKTHEQFLLELFDKHPSVTLLDRYVNTDTKVKYQCPHGINESRPWQLLKANHCCRTAYYDSGKMWASSVVTLEDAKARALRDRNNINVSKCSFEKHGKLKKLINIECTIHNVFYESYISQKIGLCPKCNTERNIKQLKIAAPLAWSSNKSGSFVSKHESRWLDSLQIKDRQVWLEDVKYKVDGYDKETNTVYLYHGRFWHGCPKKYDPEMIHPIVKIKMKELYEKTMFYENKIKEAGYNLIVKWGT